MPNLYADFYTALPEMPDRTLEAIYTTLAQVHPPLWLLNTLSRLSEPYVMAYIGPDGEIHVIHRICRHEASLEYPAPRYAGLYIGLVDETSEFGSSLAAIDEDFLGELRVDDVPSAAAVTTALANRDEPQMQVAADADAGLVQTRFCVLVPPPFVPELLRMLAQGSVWPRDLWPTALHILGRPTVLEACGQFVDWCRVAIAMGEGADNPLRGLDGDPVPVTVDECLGRARMVVRHLDFPTLPAAPTAAPTLLQPLVDAMVAFGHANRDRDDEKEARRVAEAADKVSPARIWETGIDSLLRLCQVTDVTLLPPIWAQLAKAGIKHGRRVLDAAAREPTATYPLSLPAVGRPIISPELARAVVALRFFEVRDDMEGCLSVFAASYPDQASVAAMNMVTGLYDEQTNGTTAMAYGDLLDLSKSRTMKLPVDWFQLRQVLGAHQRWLEILLGETHVVPSDLLRLLGVMDHMAATDFNATCRGARPCAEIMCAIDTYTWSWADQQARSATPVDPRYVLLAEEFQLRKWRPPTLPAQLLAMIKPAATGATHRGSATVAPTAQPSAAASGTFVAAVNDNREPGVFDGSIAIWKLLQVATPPKLACGEVPCLYYHVHGSCRTVCKYHANHRKHTAAETAVLVKYMAEHSAAANALSKRA
jgi:hypothetical protein